MSSEKSLSHYIAWLFIAAIIAGCAIMGNVIMPQAEDINAYGCNPELLAPLGLPAPPLSELVANGVDSYLHDNGRLVNYSDIPLTALTPRWVWMVLDIIFLVAFFGLLWRLSSRFTGRQRYPASAITLLGVLVLLVIPWNDYLFLQRYTTPYIWGATMMLFVAYGAMLSACGNPPRRGMLTALCIVAFIGGGWHEGISLTLLCGLVPLWFLVPRESRKAYLLQAIFLLAGILVNLTSPGQSNRTESVGVHLNLFNWFQPATLTGGIWLWPHILPMVLYLVILLSVIYLERESIRRFFRGKSLREGMESLSSLPPSVKLQVLSATVVCATLGMSLFFNSPRVAVPGLLFAIIGALSLAIGYFPRFLNKTTRKVTGIATAICAVILLVNIGLNIAMQHRLSEDHRAIESLLAESPDGTVFYDPLPWPHHSHYPWQWTMNHYYVDYVPLHFIKVHPSNRRQVALRLVPTALRNIPGDVAVEGITLIGEDFVSDREPEYTDPADAGRREVIYEDEYPFLKINTLVRTESGKEETRFFEVIPFTTSKATESERDLFYLRPVWRSHSEISDPPVEILSVSPAKYW